MFGQLKKHDKFVVIALSPRGVHHDYEAGVAITFKIAQGEEFSIATCDRGFSVSAFIKTVMSEPEAVSDEKIPMVTFIAEFTDETINAHPELEQFKIFKVEGFTAKYALPPVGAESCLLEQA